MSKLPTRGFRSRTTSKITDKLPKLRIIRPYRHYLVGAVIQPPAAAAKILMSQGIAEPEDNSEDKPEEKIEQPVKKRRGRPPKVNPEANG